MIDPERVRDADFTLLDFVVVVDSVPHNFQNESCPSAAAHAMVVPSGLNYICKILD